MPHQPPPPGRGTDLSSTHSGQAGFPATHHLVHADLELHCLRGIWTMHTGQVRGKVREAERLAGQEGASPTTAILARPRAGTFRRSRVSKSLEEEPFFEIRKALKCTRTMQPFDGKFSLSPSNSVSISAARSTAHHCRRRPSCM